MPTVSEASVFLCSMQSPVLHKTQVFITEREILTLKAHQYHTLLTKGQLHIDT